ncbi:MAG: DUF4368 domain-containing protein [Clostridiales bacterium]|nr:DUF4368 domain-containing protein [Clostridiales bacterium]
MKAVNFIGLVCKYTRLEELTPLVINEFLDKIIIHESVWSEQTETERRLGTPSHRIDVFLKYTDFHTMFGSLSSSGYCPASNDLSSKKVI